MAAARDVILAEAEAKVTKLREEVEAQRIRAEQEVEGSREALARRVAELESELHAKSEAGAVAANELRQLRNRVQQAERQLRLVRLKEKTQPSAHVSTQTAAQ